ncbi:MAG: FadR family transcriptional regulator [Hyphomicrobiales bacterium]|nr:FadR family transcriptional regulator [Hyphomicrobiales bacterium]
MRGAGIQPLRRGGLAQQVYEALLQSIITGAIAEDARLPSEHELCASFGVSRPVLREALKRLRDEGVIASRQGSRSFVMPRAAAREDKLSLDEIHRLQTNLEFRAIIEPEGAALAALRRTSSDLERIGRSTEQFYRVAVLEGGIAYHLDFEFHISVASASANSRLCEALQAVEYDVNHGIDLARHTARIDTVERRREIFEEHKRVFEMIERQDVDGARAAMRAHLEHARMRLMNRQTHTPG